MVFWLKAFNKPGQPPAYTVSQINLVSLHEIFVIISIPPLSLDLLWLICETFTFVVPDALYWR